LKRFGTHRAQHPVPRRQWSTRGVVLDGDRFTVSLDEKPLFELVDATCTQGW
jgi:hypothetical protein